jgi:hypothetical protein
MATATATTTTTTTIFENGRQTVHPVQVTSTFKMCPFNRKANQHNIRSICGKAMKIMKLFLIFEFYTGNWLIITFVCLDIDLPVKVMYK